MYWEKYGPYAIGEFSNIQFTNSVTYKFQILKKKYNIRPLFTPGEPPTYTDPILSCICGADPIVIRTLTDDVFGVKGTEAELNLINLDGQLPLSSFYAEEDDTFKIVITATYLDSGSVSQTKTIFSGFLVQEDCTEELIDIGHNIKLVFTDNLGTLKNLSFGDAVKISATSAANLRFNVANVSVVVEIDNVIGIPTGTPTYSAYVQLNTFITVGTPLVGDYVVLNDSPVGDCVYTIIKIEDVGATKRLYVQEKVLPFTNVQVDIAYITGNNPYARLKLYEIIRICLHGTNLLLEFKFGNQAYAQTETQSIPYPLDLQIDGRTFLSSEDNWKSCYDVLQDICIAFSASLFQSDNLWYMVRWNELRYQNNQIIFTNYNNYISNQFTTVQYAPNTLPGFETGVEETILRPYNFYKHSFKYNSTNQVLYNATLAILGPKIRITQNPTNDLAGYNWEDYLAPGFETRNPNSTGTYQALIRKVRNRVTNEEVDRYLVIRYLSGTPNTDNYVFITEGIEVNINDRVKFTFSWRNKLPANAAEEIPYIIFYNNNPANYYAGTNIQIGGTEQYVWTSGAVSAITRTINDTDWNDYTIETGPIPTNGKFYIYLGVTVAGSNNERWYKNLKVEIIAQTATRNQILGQEHKGYVNKIVKNNENKDITIDSTPKNSIYGTLFSSQFTNLVQNRVFTFRDGVSLWEGRLGELITKQMMDWRYIQRIKIEGKILGIYKSSFQWLTLHQALIFSLKSGKYFIFGKAVYNLREDYIEATLYEMWKDGEECTTRGVATNENLDYDFKFLY